MFALRRWNWTFRRAASVRTMRRAQRWQRTTLPELTVEGAYTFDSGVSSATRLLNRRDRPTAIFAGNDEMAVGVYVAARKAGLRIPEDLSIVGFDDTPISARIWPPLTTVRSPIREVGRAAADLLLKRGSGSENLEELQSFQLELIVRESTRSV